MTRCEICVLNSEQVSVITTVMENHFVNFRARRCGTGESQRNMCGTLNVFSLMCWNGTHKQASVIKL